MLNETLIYYTNRGSTCKLVSLDVAKAFNRFWRVGLFYKLINKIPYSSRRLLILHYCYPKGSFKLFSKNSDQWINQGVNNKNA